MPATDFFNVNAHRAYPFLTGSVGQPADGPLTLANLPPEVIVDAGFVMGPRSLFDHEEHTVRLTGISRSGDTFYFDFESDAPAMEGVVLTFIRELTDDKNLTEHLDSGEEGFSESGSEALDECDEPLWSGYLVTGDLAVLDTFLSGDGSVTGSVALEPALLQNLAGSYVSSLSVANADRTRVTAPEDCPEQTWPYPVGAVFINQRCIIDEVVFKPGYNCVIRQRDSDNSLTFEAAVGAGEGEPCAEVELFDDETPPDDSDLLGGGPRCNEVLRSINGRGGPLLRLLGGQGATFIPLPEENKLVVDFDMAGLAACWSVSTVSESI